MKSASELRLDRICHRCGNHIRWWDRVRGYKTECPDCEKIISLMVTEKITAEKGKKTPPIFPSHPHITQSYHDSQTSRSSAIFTSADHLRHMTTFQQQLYSHQMYMGSQMQMGSAGVRGYADDLSKYQQEMEEQMRRMRDNDIK